MHIVAEDLSKSFKVSKRNPGIGNAFKNLFYREYETINALDKVSFEIEEGELVGYKVNAPGTVLPAVQFFPMCYY